MALMFLVECYHESEVENAWASREPEPEPEPELDPMHFPYHVLIEVRRQSRRGTIMGPTYCGGTIIRPKWVLTSAHCVTKALSVKVYRRVTNAATGLTEDKLYRAETTFEHDNYLDKSRKLFYHFDIALVKMEQPFEGQHFGIDLPDDRDATIKTDEVHFHVLGYQGGMFRCPAVLGPLAISRYALKPAEICKDEFEILRKFYRTDTNLEHDWKIMRDKGLLSNLKEDIDLYEEREMSLHEEPSDLYIRFSESYFMCGYTPAYYLGLTCSGGDFGSGLIGRNNDGRNIIYGIAVLGVHQSMTLNFPALYDTTRLSRASGVFINVLTFRNWINQHIKE